MAGCSTAELTSDRDLTESGPIWAAIPFGKNLPASIVAKRSRHGLLADKLLGTDRRLAKPSSDNCRCGEPSFSSSAEAE